MVPPYDTVEALTSASGFVQRWNLGDPRAFFRVGDGTLIQPSCAWLPKDPLIVCHNFASTVVFDADSGRELRTLDDGAADAWPFSCADDGTCAWQRSRDDHNDLVVQNAKTSAIAHRIDLGKAQSIAIEISTATQVLAVATTDRTLRLHGMAYGSPCAPIELPAPANDDAGIGNLAIGIAEFQQLQRPGPSLFAPMRASATALAFDPTGRRIAVGTTNGVHIIDVSSCSVLATLPFDGAPVSAIVFGRLRLVAAGANGHLRVWNAKDFGEAPPLPSIGDGPASLALSPNERRVAVLGSGARVAVIDLTRNAVAGTVAFFPGDRQWLAWTPDGLFNGSEGAWQYGSWRFDERPSVAVPMETYYYDFFDADLIQHLLSGDLPSVSLAARRRDVPLPTLQRIGGRPAETVLTPGRGIESKPETATFRVSAQAKDAGTSVSSIAIVHNGFVLRHFDPPRAPSRRIEGEVEIALDPGDNTVEAYAFNGDGVRSSAVSWKQPMQGWGRLAPPSTLRVLAVGVSTYRTPALALRYAADDARLAASALQAEEGSFARTSERMANRAVDLFSSKSLAAPNRTQVVTLVDDRATRTAILDAARTLVAAATANDVVILFLAGHGLRTHSPDRYYFLPYDAALPDPKNRTAEKFEAAAFSMISDADLAQILGGLVARHSAVIVDTCHSGALAEGAKLVGPLQERTFARLVYEKGMHLISSTQSENSANEPREFGHGLLAFALFNEGLLHDLADWAPADGLIELDEWLSYGARRVVELQSSGKASATPIQAPVFVPSVMPRQAGIVLRATASTPSR